MHYARFQRHGNPEATTRRPPSPGSICEMDECSAVAKSKGLCAKHYSRMLKTGDPNTARAYVKGTLEERFWAKVARTSDDECWLWMGTKTRAGYGTIVSGSRPRYAHRLSLEIATGSEMPVGTMALHSCDNPPCVNPAHLRVGTVQDNSDDKMARGRGGHAKGSTASKARLSEADVLEIRRSRASGETYASIANRWGVGQSTVWAIATGRSWSWLFDEVG